MTLAMRQQQFSRFALPERSVVKADNLALRRDLASRFYQGGCLDHAPVINTYQDLLSKFGDLSAVTNPLGKIKTVYHSELQRVLDLTRSCHSPELVAEQIAFVRQAVLTTAFRLATIETGGDLALAIGGSAVNGVHSFLTDVDFVVLPHSAEDRNAARNVQNMMIELLDTIGIESDGNLPSLFGYRTLAELKQKYQPFTSREARKAGHDDYAFQASYPFFLFLMDLRILDVSGGKADKPAYESALKETGDSLTFLSPEHVHFVGREQFKETEQKAAAPKNPRAVDLKKSVFRLFHFSLYAARAHYGIKTSDLWQVIKELAAKGAITRGEAEAAGEDLKFLIKIRHLAGFALTNTFDSAILTDANLTQLAQVLGKSREELDSNILRSREDLLGIARKLFSLSSPAAEK